ncbi:MAG TPA: hypothetical protein DIU45_13215 [Clostridium sp.]|nr:hypothetical protein [Clostridium sp.]
MFKHRTGISPQEYLMNCRIHAANTYLMGGKYTLCEVALALGFYNEFHFSNAYKKATELTTQAYKAIFQESTSDSCMGNLLWSSVKFWYKLKRNFFTTKY